MQIQLKKDIDMTIVHYIATFILSKLHEKGRIIKESDLSKWANMELHKLNPEINPRECSLYTHSAFKLLSDEYGLIYLEEGRSVGITDKGHDVFEKYQSVEKYITNVKCKTKWNERFDFINKIIPIISAVFGAISTFVGYLLEINILNSLGFIFLGFVIGLGLNKCMTLMRR